MLPLAVAFSVAVRSAQALLAADGGVLWGMRIDQVEWMGIEGDRALLTAAVAGAEPQPDGTYLAARPKELSPANTSVDWMGRRWAMVVLPLPGREADAARLLVHEAFHTLQDRVLPLPAFDENGPGTALLDEPRGRVPLRLELEALARALETHGPARKRAVRDALFFRRSRALLSPEEAERERLLELREGMPEYTAWKLSRAPAAELAAQVRAAERDESYARSFAYATGPAWGYLLDALSPGWRRRLARTRDLQKLLPLDPGNRPSTDYGEARIRAEEDARWNRLQRELAELRARFVDGPVLRLRPGALRVSFDYRGQRTLPGAGTVMQKLSWTDGAGSSLTADQGALIAADWSELRIPLVEMPADGTLQEARTFTGPGWTLTLAAGWKLSRDGKSVMATRH